MIDIQALNHRLDHEGAKWRAGETYLTKLSTDHLRKLATGRSPLHKGPPPPDPTPAPAFDPAVDWRDRNGKNYVTPIKDQSNCGACTSFAVIALVESMALIEHGVTLDLSEADLAFCGTHTNDCLGWVVEFALTDMINRGAVTETRLPYFQDFLPHHSTWNGDVPQRIVIPDHDAHAVKVTRQANIYDVAQRKAYLTTTGPLACSITYYDEFGSFKGEGIYSPSSTAVKNGGHEILIIGYSEAEQYWLIKNSWNESWGNKGFGKIAYGACDIDIISATEHTYFTRCDGVQIPQRVLDEILQTLSATNLISIGNAICCDAFYSADDKDRHVIVATSTGDISEVYYRHAPVSKTHLLQVNGLIDLAAFYTDDDKTRHVLTLDNSGKVTEIYYSTAGISQTPIATIPNAVKISGFYSPNDHRRHALIATTDGKIIEVAYGGAAPGQKIIATLGATITDICAFYTADDQYSHAIVATVDGNITEVFYSSAKAGGTSVIANVADPKTIAGFYSGNQYFSRRVQVQTGNNDVVEIRFDTDDTPIIHPLYDGAPIADIGGFISADDGFSHCIVLQTNAEIVEMYY
jgi:Papain family cysteine protease